MNKTYRAISSQDTWLKMKGEVENYVKQEHKNLIERKGKSKEHYDKTTKQTKLQVVDKVLLFDETVRRGRSR
jgi:hypothetical protein